MQDFTARSLKVVANMYFPNINITMPMFVYNMKDKNPVQHYNTSKMEQLQELRLEEECISFDDIQSQELKQFVQRLVKEAPPQRAFYLLPDYTLCTALSVNKQINLPLQIEFNTMSLNNLNLLIHLSNYMLADVIKQNNILAVAAQAFDQGIIITDG